MLPALRHAMLTPPTFKPESRIPGLKLLVDRFSPVTREAGQASLFTAATFEYLSITGNATLRGAAAGWWRCGWIYLNSTAGSKVVQSCLGTNVGYQLSVNATPALVLTAGDGAATATATHGSTLSTGTWYFFFIYYDGVNIGVSLNDGADVTAALAPYSPGAVAWQLGADLTPANYFDGRMQCMGGADGTLTAAQRTLLYNGGTPLAYDQIPGAISQQASFFYWELNEPSGARADLGYNAYSLTDNNTVTTAAGTVLNACGQWNNRATANHFSQATQANKPVLRKGILTFDGTNDFLANASQVLSGQSGAVLAVARMDSTPNSIRSVYGQGDDATAVRYIALRARQNNVQPQPAIEQDENDVADTIRATTTSVVLGKRMVWVWQSNGSAYSIRFDAKAQALSVDAGANGGDWFGDVTAIDRSAIGAEVLVGVEDGRFPGPIFLVAAWEPDLPVSIIAQLERMVARDYAVAV